MTVKEALNDLNNAVLDLQSSDLTTYVRPLKNMARILVSDELKSITGKLRDRVNFDAFVAAANPGGSMAGSASLNWPEEKEQELGLSIVVIERGAEDSNWFISFAYDYYYDRKPINCIHNLVRSLIVPFNRDFSTYVERQKVNLPRPQAKPTDWHRVFIAHGHDDGPREKVARFVEKIGLEPVILDEQANRGMTISEKFETHSDVGYAIVLLTPDDTGRGKSESQPRD
ncbi:MAG: nucleotide-binding protein [Rhodobacteraceae bacterium]|nr:nucleotide-binding protein [Paracoccaceae bacterium]